ncbi:MAG: hypothetical protein PVH61_34190 [Candidatus Aminicenantes bacterium]|jgi:hypothetical protein
MDSKIIIFVIALFLLVNFSTASIRVTLPEILEPFDMVIDKGQMFISEKETVYIYSLEDFKLVKKFGTKGEGPKEFMVTYGWSVIVNVHQSELVCGSIGKISVFTRDGVFKKVVKPAPYSILCHRENIEPLGDQYVGIRNKRTEKFYEFAATIYDSNFNGVKEFYQFDANIWRRGKKYNPVKYTQYFRKIYVYGDNIFVNTQNDRGEILVFESTGKQLYSISHEYERVKFTEKDKKNWLADFSIESLKPIYQRLKDRWIYPDNFPAWQKFQIVDDKIYIQTYKRNKEGENKFFIMDLKGKLLKKLEVPLAEIYAFTPYPYTINRGKIYQLVENKNTEEWELHIKEIKGDL